LYFLDIVERLRYRISVPEQRQVAVSRKRINNDTDFLPGAVQVQPIGAISLGNLTDGVGRLIANKFLHPWRGRSLGEVRNGVQLRLQPVDT
jgi:hypothetical protein